MNFSSGLTKFVIFIILVGWLLLLSKFILLKNPPQDYKHFFTKESVKQSVDKGLKGANFLPFKMIRFITESDNFSAEYKIENIAGNIVGFIPLGILIPMLFTGMRKVFRTVLFIFFISLAFETIQLCTGLGIFDVDDLILNVTGGFIGYLMYKFLTFSIGKKRSAK